MNESPEPAGSPAYPTPGTASASTISSRSDFVVALQAAVQLALLQRARRMLWVDRDYAGWPMDDAALLDMLTQWLQLPQRRLVLLADDYGEVSRRCSRFVAWYRLWSHAVTPFTPEPGDRSPELPGLVLVDDLVMVQLVDREHWRGRTSREPVELRLCRDRIDAILQRSDPAFPASTLGL